MLMSNGVVLRTYGSQHPNSKHFAKPHSSTFRLAWVFEVRLMGGRKSSKIFYAQRSLEACSTCLCLNLRARTLLKALGIYFFFGGG